ncbi:TIM21 [Nesidiocoris tenuis]|uniref:Mitochondrial import inner membrane translocase subunit Tim21 n=1 Tax=Nesidiocoris tenuis TaxID=355587 RepID=A0ABN7A8E8_9HEMI|nr:TIM21 [Nesidiocoris tenuis]
MASVSAISNLGRITAFPYRYVQAFSHSYPLMTRVLPTVRKCPVCARCFSQKSQQEDSSGKLVASEQGRAEVSTHVLETVKETTKTASYSLVILAGVGIACGLFYVVFSELFSSKSPNSIYSKAVDRCSNDPKVKDTLGEPIKGHGEETSRRRRRFVSHVKYVKDGVEHMRMKFYLKGSRKSATVNLEVKEDENGKFQYRYMFVQLEDYPYRVIVLEDNRQDTSVALSAPRIDTEPPPAPIWQ